jgi:hypothetical protein
MSIFNQPIDSRISGSLARRQTNMSEGTEDKYQQRYDLSFTNPQNSWVSLKSSVNVNGDDGKLAKNNILQGGTTTIGNLALGKPKAGISPTGSYALKNSDGSTNKLGVKPMPGINSVSVDNIGAYGSLRKATVNFQCWDIEQLQILEKLYMRPGYTVLLEFGRANYIDQKGKIVSPVDDIKFFDKKEINLQEYLNELHQNSLKSEGNYDAFFGYITNYGWSARSDGGYDCKTEIISTGEILESLKVNYALSGATDYASIENDPLNAKFKGLILPNIPLSYPVAAKQTTRLNTEYSDNIISGLMYEMYLAIFHSNSSPYANIINPRQFVPGNGSVFLQSSLTSNIQNSLSKTLKFQINKKDIVIDYNTRIYNSTGDPQDPNDPSIFNEANANAYITLRSFIELLNTFILPQSFDKAGVNKGGLVSLSVDDRTYLSKSPLLCLYNSLVLSTNPDICWVKSENWPNLVSGITIQTNINPVNPTVFSDPDIQNGAAVRQKLIGWIDYLIDHDETQNESILQQIEADRKASGNAKYTDILAKNYQVLRGAKSLNNPNSYEWSTYITEGGQKQAKLNQVNASWFTNVETFGDLLSKTTSYLSSLILKASLKVFSTDLDNEINQIQTQINNAQAQQNQINQTQNQLTNLSSQLKIFNDSFSKNFLVKGIKGSDINFGEIGNIYINLKYIYKLAKDEGLVSQDSTGRNSLLISSFLNKIMQDIQSNLGSINQFELHIDPIDSIGRIIDLNYINLNKQPNLFKFEIGSNKSIVRDLKLESQIFSDQSSIIAISAQDQAGALGENNSTLVGFNEGITDRMIVRKDSYLNSIHNREQAEATLIYNYISSLSYITNEYLKTLLGLSTKTIINPAFTTSQYGISMGGDPTLTEPVSSFFNPGQALSYSNSLRDIMYFFSSVTSFDESNSEKQFIPSLISLTIDGLSGFIIGNLFQVDTDFVPNYYKKGNKLAYTLTKVNHELINNDWLTTISGYPFNVDANNNSLGNNLLKKISQLKVIVSINPSPIGNSAFGGAGGPQSNVSLANKTFNDIINSIATQYNVEYKSSVPSAKANLDPTFSEAMRQLFSTMAQSNDLKGEKLSITIMYRNDNTPNHPKGKGLDFQLTFIDNNRPAIVSGKYPKFKTANIAKTKKTYAEQREVWVKIYGEDNTTRIERVYNYLINRFNGIVNIGNDVSIDMDVFGTKIRMINENFYPTAKATGPHFHFQLL